MQVTTWPCCCCVCRARHRPCSDSPEPQLKLICFGSSTPQGLLTPQPESYSALLDTWLVDV